MSNIAPSKSTVYVSNIPFDLKNNDIHKLFEKHGKIVKLVYIRPANSDTLHKLTDFNL